MAQGVNFFSDIFNSNDFKQSDLNEIRDDNKIICELFQEYLNKANDSTASAASVEHAYDQLPTELAMFVTVIGNGPGQYRDLLNQINEGTIVFPRI